MELSFGHLPHVKRGSFRVPLVSITNTSWEIISFLKGTYGGTVRNQKSYAVHHRQAWVWSVNYDTAIDFLKRIEPHLKHDSKITRANLILNEYKLLTRRNGRYTGQEREAKLNFESRFLAS